MGMGFAAMVDRQEHNNKNKAGDSRWSREAKKAIRGEREGLLEAAWY